jgi:hypothetical protein
MVSTCHEQVETLISSAVRLELVIAMERMLGTATFWGRTHHAEHKTSNSSLPCCRSERRTMDYDRASGRG